MESLVIGIVVLLLIIIGSVRDYRYSKRIEKSKTEVTKCIDKCQIRSSNKKRGHAKNHSIPKIT